ncbi:MAG: XRE family transcriptional regulator [Rhodobacteraceae bacterium]|nr:XRE family transcriptional regulator [Paracoccaceae bacterium]
MGQKALTILGQITYMPIMEEFIKEVEIYATAMGLLPSTVIQRAANLGGGKWAVWKNGGSCSMRTADRIRAHMTANPPRAKAQDGEAA